MPPGLFRYTTKTGHQWGVQLKYKCEDGLWRRKTWRGFASQRDAQRFLDLRKQERYQDKFFPGGSRLYTVGDYLQQWLTSYVKPHCKYSTGRGYENILNRYVMPRIGDKELSAVTIHAIKAMFADLHQEGLSRQTIKNIFGPVREAFNHAVGEGLIQTNPCAILTTQLKAVKHRPAEVVPLTPSQTNALLNAALSKEHVLYLAILLGVRAGLRLGEVLGLSWEDVDYDKRQARIRQARVRRRLTTCKNHQARTVDLTDSVVTALEGMSKLPDEPLILHRKGKPVLADWPTQAFQSLLPGLGLPKMRFHDLRHAYASQLIALGANIKYIQGQMGHSSITVTMDLYGHWYRTERHVDQLEKNTL